MSFDDPEAEIASFLAAHPGITATLTCPYAPEEWEGTVDGHRFFFHERMEVWRLYIDSDEDNTFEQPIAAGIDDELGATVTEHLAFIVRRLRDHLRRESCSHDGALAFCAHCGWRREGAR